jgi:hypothetical protein
LIKTTLWKIPLSAVDDIPEEVCLDGLEAFLQISNGEWRIVVGQLYAGRLRSSYTKELE